MFRSGYGYGRAISKLTARAGHRSLRMTEKGIWKEMDDLQKVTHFWPFFNFLFVIPSLNDANLTSATGMNDWVWMKIDVFQQKITSFLHDLPFVLL